MKLVDLFSGCGGFSLGAHQAGFDVAAAFDNDSILSSSYSFNFPKTKLFLRDVAKLDRAGVIFAAGGKPHGIFGGPPCQGFSGIGHRHPLDPRRRLLRHFFRIVEEVRPVFFVMENVPGLSYVDARSVLDKSLKLVKDWYDILGPFILDAADYGAATKRLRLFVVGMHKDKADPLKLEDVTCLQRHPATVKAAIADLLDAVFVGEEDEFDVWQIARTGRPSGYARGLRSKDARFTGQRKTEHSNNVARRFENIAEGEVDAVGRHPRLAWSGQCPTLRAGTGADRGSYQSVRPIHPEQPRVITVREAARLQGFPDKHRFHPTVWHSFRMIGNSVSPIIANAIFTAIRKKLVSQTPLMAAAE